MQRLRTRAEIRAVSSFYESQAAGGAEGPAYLNVAARFVRSWTPRLSRALRATSSWPSDGRAARRKLAPRPIDVDVLVYRRRGRATATRDAPLQSRPARRDRAASRRSRQPTAAFAGASAGCASIPIANRKRPRSGSRSIASASRACGASFTSKSTDATRVYNGEFTMVADLAADKSGVHMSRFAEILEEATLDVLARDEGRLASNASPKPIAREIVHEPARDSRRRTPARRVRVGALDAGQRQARRGDVYARRDRPRGRKSARAASSASRRKGMTACPCAQAMVREHALARTARNAGFSGADAARALDALPVATHNQRGRGAILIGVDEARADVIRAEDLVEIVENSMSSETYDLLKRPDEFFVVNKAHHNPKFVEDVVRGILARALDMYADFGDDTFIFASHVNEESIHKHDAFAERFRSFRGTAGRAARRGRACRRRPT